MPLPETGKPFDGILPDGLGIRYVYLGIDLIKGREDPMWTWPLGGHSLEIEGEAGTGMGKIRNAKNVKEPLKKRKKGTRSSAKNVKREKEKKEPKERRNA